MKPARFEYTRPNSVAEATAALSSYRAEAKILAGGQSLVPMLNFRLLSPKILIDINGLSNLSFIDEGADGSMRVGALIRHSQLMTSATVARRFPIVAEALRHVAHLAIRNRGTLGGSLAHADPAAELPLMAVLLGAKLQLSGSDGSRQLAAEDFFAGALSTAIDEGELVTEILFPPLLGTGWGFREFAPRKGDFALAAVGAILKSVDGIVTEAAVAVTGVGDVPMRMHAAEAALRDRPLDANAVSDASAEVRAAVAPNDSLHASAAYRVHLVGGLAARALEDAGARLNSSFEALRDRQ